MKILFASPEAVPFVKTGGLADVSGALPKALAEMGHEVFLILPKYRGVEDRRFHLAKTGIQLKVPISQRMETAEIYSCKSSPNLQVLFLRQDAYYDRDYLYGTSSGDFEDNAERLSGMSQKIDPSGEEGDDEGSQHDNVQQPGSVRQFFVRKDRRGEPCTDLLQHLCSRQLADLRAFQTRSGVSGISSIQTPAAS